MHLGRFHCAIEQLHIYYKSTNPIQHIQNIINSLNQVAANPGHLEIAKNYTNSLEECRITLESSTLNNPRPILKNILKSIKAEEYIGNKLFDKIKTAIASHSAAPSLASQALTNIQRDTQAFFNNIESIDNCFGNLEVEYDDLSAGEAEIGLLIPRNENQSTLKDLSKEFSQWNKALSPIVELYDPDAKNLQIKICSTTDWMVYLSATPVVLLGVHTCVKRVNLILNELIETRELITKLSKRKPSSPAIEMLESEHSEMASENIRKLAEELVDERYTGTDDGRKNELKNAMTQALTTVADKISTGASIEVRMIPPPLEKSQDNSELDAQDEMQSQSSLTELANNLDGDIDGLLFNGSSLDVKALLENIINKNQQPD